MLFISERYKVVGLALSCGSEFAKISEDLHENNLDPQMLCQTQLVHKLVKGCITCRLM